ncbi:platelet-activating factor acetylhydrolase IB subunit [Anatilimnocola sp. NA78]|uniref:platelet-activating factor acetylhydrolase IB subunit n=1 Tax=Anatilimnocola sp. NA78 TaxID=3415683 RepID=UPI003CE4F632
MNISRRALFLALLFAGALLPASLIGQEAKTEVKPEVKANDAVVPAPREGGWMNRHNSFNERVKKGNVDLLLIGDSITQGWEGQGKKVWEEFYTKRNAVNLGIGGDRTQHVLWRLDNGNVEGIKPKAAVLMIGTNNARANTPEQTAEGVKAVVEKLKAKLPETKLLVLAIFPRSVGKDDELRKKNAAVNESIAKLADDKQVFFLDIGPKFLAEDGTLSKEIMPDLLHLNEKSYRIWAEAIEPKLAELMGEKS